MTGKTDNGGRGKRGLGKIPVIDIFAGPGGLGEGFSSLQKSGKRPFSVKLSIEKDSYAHCTLELRAFVRQFDLPPPEYYKYLEKKIDRAGLFAAHPEAAKKATAEAWHAELGAKETPAEKVDARITTALGEHNDRWALIGGPPCQAYSLVGRSRIRGESKKKYESDKRHYLYKQYLRILAEHSPPVFVMENVKGLLSARVKEQRIVESIIRDLSAPAAATAEDGSAPANGHTYTLYSLVHGKANGADHRNPEDFLVRSEDYGIPQTRHRIILLGVRADIAKVPRTLSKNGGEHSVCQAIGDLPLLRSRLSKEKDTDFGWYAAVRRAATEDWFDDPDLDSEVRTGIKKAIKAMPSGLSSGWEFVSGKPKPAVLDDWYRDPKLKGFCNHTTRGHMNSDLQRYLFVSVYGKIHGRSPGLEVFPAELLPDHDNVADALDKGKFNDRFRVQIGDRPSTTITSHISKDGHYFIHHDPTQCRSLTVREAARLQTFPDNYFFEGPRTQQYKQVGNAVPPLLARQIAEIVADLLP